MAAGSYGQPVESSLYEVDWPLRCQADSRVSTRPDGNNRGSRPREVRSNREALRAIDNDYIVYVWLCHRVGPVAKAAQVYSRAARWPRREVKNMQSTRAFIIGSHCEDCLSAVKAPGRAANLP
jgi:hypothetical protein